MARYIPLDAGVIGLLSSSPAMPEVASCLAWLDRMNAAGAKPVLPDVTVYEVRRELVRVGATVKLARLDKLKADLLPAPVTPEAWNLAGDFWAIVRRGGKPTADRHALDADAILAAVAVTMAGPGDSATITTNVGHLARFPGVDARAWSAIA